MTQKVKELMINIYIEDSGRAAIDYADDNYAKFTGRNNPKMESKPSQETQVTELRMESLHSQDNLLDLRNHMFKKLMNSCVGYYLDGWLGTVRVLLLVVVLTHPGALCLGTEQHAPRFVMLRSTTAV